MRTSPYYPQSNGKMERWYQTAKGAIRRQTPLSLADARQLIARFVDQYNHVRLHSALGYIAPMDQLEGRAEQIRTERARKLQAAHKARNEHWLAQSPSRSLPALLQCLGPSHSLEQAPTSTFLPIAIEGGVEPCV